MPSSRRHFGHGPCFNEATTTLKRPVSTRWTSSSSIISAPPVHDPVPSTHSTRRGSAVASDPLTGPGARADDRHVRSRPGAPRQVKPSWSRGATTSCCPCCRSLRLGLIRRTAAAGDLAMVPAMSRAGSSDPEEFDLVVLGSGPAGEKGATQAAYFGYRVAVIERGSLPGGAAIAASGVPVKALRDTAVYLTGWSRREVYGVGISLAPDLVMNRLRARIDDVVTTMTNAVCENLKRHDIEVVQGDASLAPSGTVIVRTEEGEERILKGRVVLLATGSRPHHPPNIHFDGIDVHDSQSITTIDRLPETLMVVGGGPVGCEYASIFAHLGVEVTLVDRGSRLLPLLDAELSAELAQSLQRVGTRLLLEAQLESVEHDGD